MSGNQRDGVALQNGAELILEGLSQLSITVVALEYVQQN